MYNLFVSNTTDSWNGEPFILENERCLEYTDPKLVELYKDLSDANVAELKKYPCIFCYEKSCEKNPYVGFIKDITRRSKKTQFEYEIVIIDKFLTHEDLVAMMFDLDIMHEWEIGRTHWALKDVNLPKELAKKHIQLPISILRMATAVDVTKQVFEVAFSFPSDARSQIESIVLELEKLIGPNSYFYDNNYQAQLARPNSSALLQEIYRKRSKLIAVFLSSQYQHREWCGLESRVIQEMIKNKEYEKIMLFRLDEGKVDGFFEIDIQINVPDYTTSQLANFIKQRIDTHNS